MTQALEGIGSANQSLVVVPPTVHAQAMNDVGAFFEPLSKVDRRILADDHLNLTKATNRGRLLERYVALRGKKVLEIGSGFGTNSRRLDQGIWDRRLRCRAGKPRLRDVISGGETPL